MDDCEVHIALEGFSYSRGLAGVVHITHISGAKFQLFKDTIYVMSSCCGQQLQARWADSNSTVDDLREEYYCKQCRRTIVTQIYNPASRPTDYPHTFSVQNSRLNWQKERTIRWFEIEGLTILETQHAAACLELLATLLWDKPISYH